MAAFQVTTHSERPMTAADVVALNREVGWWPERTEEDLRVVLEAGPAVGAWVGAHVVGFARAISDGRLHSYIDDVMVHPNYRRRGIATALTETLADSLQVPVVTLFCHADLVSLYEATGFSRTRQVVLHRVHRER